MKSQRSSGGGDAAVQPVTAVCASAFAPVPEGEAEVVTGSQAELEISVPGWRVLLLVGHTGMGRCWSVYSRMKINPQFKLTQIKLSILY